MSVLLNNVTGVDEIAINSFDPTPCRLPVDEERKRIEKFEDDREGSHSLLHCDLCKLQGRGGDYDSYDQIRKSLDTNSEFIPQDELNSLIAEKFNETCVKY